MQNGGQLSYVQARLQARHGARPGEDDWQAIEATRSLASYLERVGTTSLSRFSERIRADTAPHEIELRVREARRAYVAEIAGWMPEPWRTAIAWAGLVPELPGLAYLLDGGAAWPWMSDDALLAPLARALPSSRLEELPALGLAALAGEDSAAGTIAVRWLAHWRSRWPPTSSAERAQLETLIALARRHFEQLGRAGVASSSTALRRSLDKALVRLFRRGSGGPVAVFCALALTALDVERLRGGLMRRQLIGFVAAKGAP